MTFRPLAISNSHVINARSARSTAPEAGTRHRIVTLKIKAFGRGGAI